MHTTSPTFETSTPLPGGSNSLFPFFCALIRKYQVENNPRTANVRANKFHPYTSTEFIGMSTKTELDSPLANVASEIEERRCDLIGRHRELKNKVATMERSIPALMAYNMWMTERDCRDGPYNKVREIVNRFSPQPDPADRLLAELKSAVDGLHQETSQLHDKIIDADVKLEETGMELESLELANKEMEEKLTGLRNEVQRYNTPSLHSVHSEDLICLRKIRQLAEEELKLKNCISELESKEFMYRRQMGKLLSCKKFQRDSGKMTERVQSHSRGIGKKLFDPLEDYTLNKHVTKKKYHLEDKKRKACCPCATSITLTAYEKASKKPLGGCEKLYPPLSCCVPLDHPASRATASKSRDCTCCKSCRRVSSALFKSKSPCSTKPPCESLFSVASKTGVSRPPKQLAQSSVPCDPSETCNECTTPAACKQININRYDCEEKRRGELSIPCDCNVRSLDEAQSVPSGMLHSESEIDDSNSDEEEFCECCSCGCEANDDLL
ncbi:uncharacterized protein LOC112452609 isoform X1 [Temnothorax curvispinosus]|uniref:Uncharacterized protein LOC112452609 isoform X1 n=1 Tax=Temnothorax curvispinosus TaxID=300111 RepID=A0A6J1PGV3_9HYME|nr:uncharacterized protein LOC112452609 isoform X1 [Temnothorax curvispinosus]XP_024868664.1 uncharacterized protein LOC112452609 isoform X1 [Temnothorax curvispinosus]